MGIHIKMVDGLWVVDVNESLCFVTIKELDEFIKDMIELKAIYGNLNTKLKKKFR